MGFALLGFALDAKPNIIVALIPTIIIFLLLEFIIPIIKEKNLKETPKITLKLTTLSLIIFIPLLIYSRIIPEIVLNPQEKTILHKAQKKNFYSSKNRGFGQIRVLEKNFNREGFKQFISQTNEKLIALKSLFNQSYLLLVLFGVLLIALTVFSYYQIIRNIFLFISSFFLYLLLYGGYLVLYMRGIAIYSLPNGCFYSVS